MIWLMTGLCISTIALVSPPRTLTLIFIATITGTDSQLSKLLSGLQSKDIIPGFLMKVRPALSRQCLIAWCCVAIILEESHPTEKPSNKDISAAWMDNSVILEMRNFVFCSIKRLCFESQPSHIERRQTVLALTVKSVLVSSLVLWIEPL